MPSILYSQTDSLRCFTVKQQNEIITKLVERIECLNENKRYARLNQINDSIIATQDNTIFELKRFNILVESTLLEETERRKEAESETRKQTRRKKIFQGLSIVGFSLASFVWVVK